MSTFIKNPFSRANNKVYLALTVMVVFFDLLAYGQNGCPNANFSQGNFSNWYGYYGDFYNPSQYSGFVTTGNARHLIIQGPGYLDGNTCNGLNTVLPGEAFCARLGNDGTDAEAEQLRYSMTVTPDNNLFIYKYAVVLQDPNHTPEDQPSFTIEVKNQNGVVFDPTCGYFYVYAQYGLPGWNQCVSADVVWKDWTTVGLDLTPLIGQTISIEFTTRDCERGGHFGYAYISTTCAKLEMNVSYCPQSTSATLTAPPGFTYLWGNGATSQSIVVNNPAPGMSDSCLLTSVNGCQVTIYALIQPTVVTSNFTFVPQCPGVPVQFTDASTINQNTIANN